MRPGGPYEPANGLCAHERAIRRQNEEAGRSLWQLTHPSSQRRVHAEPVVRVEDVSEGVRVQLGSQAVGFVAKHHDRFDPHVAEGVSRARDGGNAVEGQQQLGRAHSHGEARGEHHGACVCTGHAPLARTLIISATMLMASSAGVSAPMEIPIGVWMRSMSLCANPSSASALKMCLRFVVLPMRPM